MDAGSCGIIIIIVTEIIRSTRTVTTTRSVTITATYGVLRITTALDDLQPRPITGSPAGPRPLGQRGNVGPGTNQSLRQTRYSVLQILQENPRIYVRSSYGVYSWTQKEYRGTNTPYVRRSSLADYHDYHQTEFSPRIRIRRGLTSVFLVGRGGGNSDHHPPCRSREHGWDRLVGWLG